MINCDLIEQGIKNIEGFLIKIANENDDQLSLLNHPRLYCKLGHLNLLLENYEKGSFNIHASIRNQLISSFILINPYYLPTALSAYQKYYKLTNDNWKVSRQSDSIQDQTLNRIKSNPNEIPFFPSRIVHSFMVWD